MLPLASNAHVDLAIVSLPSAACWYSGLFDQVGAEANSGGAPLSTTHLRFKGTSKWSPARANVRYRHALTCTVHAERAQFTRCEITHLPPNPSSRRRRFALEGRPQPPRPPREGARLPHPPCLRLARVTVICLIRWCSASSPDASHRSRERSLRRGAGAPPPPPTGRRWGYFLGVYEGEQRPLCLELGPDPPLLGRAALC